jgi:hypothetical protein
MPPGPGGTARAKPNADGTWKKSNAAVPSAAVAAPTASPHTVETTSTPGRNTTPNEISGTTRRSRHITSVCAAINATATTIPNTSGGDVGISSDGARSRINQQAYPRLADLSPLAQLGVCPTSGRSSGCRSRLPQTPHSDAQGLMACERIVGQVLAALGREPAFGIGRRAAAGGLGRAHAAGAEAAISVLTVPPCRQRMGGSSSRSCVARRSALAYSGFTHTTYLPTPRPSASS